VNLLARNDRRVRTVEPPPDCAIAGDYPGADLADAFAVDLPGGGPHDIRRLAMAALAEPPAWLRLALNVRDAVAGRFGIRTSGAIRTSLIARDVDRIDFFRVLARSEREIVLGEDDSHLDFKLSLMLGRCVDGAGDELVATTIVHCHNRVGRAYLAAITPGHRLVVRSGLRHAARSAARRTRATAD
jgi:hypothetical protein